MNQLAVKFRRLAHAGDLALPSYATSGAAGLDLAAAIDQPICLKPNMRQAIPTGFAMALPAGYEAQIRPRSGLALKYGITVANAPGTIDSDYRGEVRVALVQLGAEPVRVEPLDRIAQLVVSPVVQVVWEPLATDADGKPLAEATERGSGGFGHTGQAGRKGDRKPS